jgi:hypothetical protein
MIPSSTLNNVTRRDLRSMNDKTIRWAAAILLVMPFLAVATNAMAKGFGVSYPPHCNRNSDCPDNNPCTVDRCESGRNSDGTSSLRCTHNKVDTNDLNPCTTDSCDSTGVHHVMQSCPAPKDACHLQGVCQAYTWQNMPKPQPVCGNPPRCTWYGYSAPSTYCTTPIASDGTTCDDGNSATLNDACHNGVCSGTVLPTTCAAYKAQNPGATDGTYTLNVAGHPVGIYCYQMNSPPKEYLTLAKTGDGFNFSRYAPNQTTWYSKVRFHTDTLTVDVADATFATNVGTNPQNFATIPYATAEDCIGSYSQAGTANVDLTGTVFAVAPGQFFTQGWHQAGSISYGSQNKIVNLTGGGYCGLTGTANYAATPLQLVYQP